MARIFFVLFAVIAIPYPEPHMRIPLLLGFFATSDATLCA